MKLNALLADEFREFSSSGTIYSKQDILKNLPAVSPTQFAISEFQIEALSPNVVLATYKASYIRDEEISFSLRCSIWKIFENRWKIVFHQGTK